MKMDLLLFAGGRVYSNSRGLRKTIALIGRIVRFRVSGSRRVTSILNPKHPYTLNPLDPE